MICIDERGKMNNKRKNRKTKRNISEEVKGYNEYKYKLCLAEYKNCIERNNSLNTKISILIAT